jgi:hypothetical protein
MRPNSWRSDRARALGAAFVLSLAAIVPASAGAQARPADALGWFTGCWERRTATAVIEEHWSSTTGGMLLGFAKTSVRDTVREYEFLHIYGEGDTLVLNALPSRQRPAWFRARPPYDSVVSFANPAHDFPQRIIYRRVGSDSLRARIEGTRNGQERGVDYAYARVACR